MSLGDPSALCFRSLLGSHRVLNPGQRDQEKGRQQHAKQRVDPDQGDVKRPQSNSDNQGAQRAAKAVFHDSSSEISGAGTILAQCRVIWKRYFSSTLSARRSVPRRASRGL